MLVTFLKEVWKWFLFFYLLWNRNRLSLGYLSRDLFNGSLLKSINSLKKKKHLLTTNFLIAVHIRNAIKSAICLTLSPKRLKASLSERQQQLYKLLEDGKRLLLHVSCSELETQLTQLGDHWLSTTTKINKELHRLDSTLKHWIRSVITFSVSASLRKKLT